MSADYDVIGSNLTGGIESTKSNERIRQIVVPAKFSIFFNFENLWLEPLDMILLFLIMYLMLTQTS